ncbi:hypothetical protein M422DRAFT_244311 [Sphaerobolus stellatus SS14]|nr:hypothetical protein M422DRAFT_244311 [Sphaerobolus stellatus SS14]
MAFVAPLRNEILSVPDSRATAEIQVGQLHKHSNLMISNFVLNSANAPIISNSFRNKQNDRGEPQGRNS